MPKKSNSKANPSPTTIPSVLAGVAGDYFVAAELSRRGYIASISLQAIARDPNFLLAYCQLADGHDQLYFVGGVNHTPARLALAEAAVQTAMRLGPDAGETHLWSWKRGCCSL
jgi:hypothetical protein